MTEKMMSRISSLVERHYKGIILLSAILVLVSLVAASQIQVTTEMKDMLPRDNPQVRQMDQIEQHFSGGTSLFITIEGDDKKRMIAAAETLADRLQQHEDLLQLLRAINFKLDRGFAVRWGLMLQDAEGLADSRQMFERVNLLPLLTALNDSFEEDFIDNSKEKLSTSRQERDAVELLSQLESFAELLREYLADPQSAPLAEQGEKLAEAFLFGDLYAFSPDNSMLVLTLSPNFYRTDINATIKLMDGIKEIVGKVQAIYPELVIGYTGEIAMEADEQHAMRLDMLVPALVALVIILILFVFSFRQIRAMALALLTLVVGVIFNYGLVGITFGEVNLLTSIMGALLIGLGIDYGIQMVTNFTTYLEEGASPQGALRLTYQKAGMGTLLAACTTAVAFFVMAVTGTQALSEFGIVAGMGIVACFLAMFFLLPALLYWLAPSNRSSRLPMIDYAFLVKMGRLVHRHWIVAGLAEILLTAALGFSVFSNQLEMDLLKLEPQHMPSIKTYYRLMDRFDLSPMAAMISIESLEETHRLTKELEGLNSVSQIDSLAYYLPTSAEQEARLAEIRKIRKMGTRYGDVHYSSTDLEEFAYQIQRLEWNVIEAGDLSVAGLGEANKIVRKRDYMIREIMGAETGRPGKEVFQRLISLVEDDPKLYADRLTDLDKHFAMAMDSLIDAMAAVDRQISPADLPESIQEQLLSSDGQRNLIAVYPRRAVADKENGLLSFAEQLAEVSPMVTGTPSILRAWLDEVIGSTSKAAISILVVVFLFLFVSLRSLRYSLLALVPLLVGLVWMLGLYPLLGWRINMINMALVPLIIGMGIDFGIHIVHRYQVEQDIGKVLHYTGKAVFLSACTTMIGFGSLGLIGSFEMVASIGTILFLGIATCLAASLTLLPALIGLSDALVRRSSVDQDPKKQKRSRGNWNDESI